VLRWRHWSEAGSVGCGLGAKFIEVEIRTSTVTGTLDFQGSFLFIT
jgi:hypothetical protein